MYDYHYGYSGRFCHCAEPQRHIESIVTTTSTSINPIMPKDYQEIERIVEELKDWGWNTPGGREAFRHEQIAAIRNALTTYGNAREQVTVEEIIKIAENINISTEIDFIKPEDQKGYRRAQTDMIKAIKK
jgi:hypothetical protein